MRIDAWAQRMGLVANQGFYLAGHGSDEAEFGVETRQLLEMSG